MSSARVSRQNENNFMESLLSGMDSTYTAPAPITPGKTKKPQKVERILEKMKSPKFKTPTKSKGQSNLPNTQTAQEMEDIAALLEGAEDWDWSDMNDFMTPQKAVPSSKKSKSTPGRGLGSPRKSLPQVPKREYQKEVCTRCIIESISERRVSGRLHKVLVVKLDPGEERRSVTLQDDWIVTDARIGDIINVIGPFETPAATSSTSFVTPSIRITSKSNYLILHPDILITATALSNASQCRRKPLLSSLVRSTSDITPALVWGNILHEVMQLCMSENRWEQKWVEERINEAVKKNLVNIVRIEMTVEEALTEVKVRAKGLLVFAEKYLGNKPKPAGVLSDTRSKSDDTQALLAISDLLDVEEDIWSPTYGLKGKIDATVHSIISQPKPPANQIQNLFTKSKSTQKGVDMETITGAVPFEIKTGRSIAGMEHRAQTMLYTLLVAERYHQEVGAGLLYYTQKEEVVKVPVAVEHVKDTSSPIADTYDLKTSHLTSSQLDFFKKWERLISLEEKDIHRFKKELWTMGAKEREEKGRCFAGMVLDTAYDPTAPISLQEVGYYESPSDNDEADLINSGKDKIHKFTYRFARSSQPQYRTQFKTQLSHVDEEEAGSLLSGHMAIGEAITISVEPDLLALARGFIVDLSPSTVVIGVDHELDLERIGWRDNLAQMFYAEGDSKRLRLIVDLRPPEFETLDWINNPYSNVWKEYLKHTEKLNVNQKKAVKRVISARDYALILGMPGTGKTGVIASLVKVLVGMGRTVLVSAYTHSAVDNVLLRLKSEAGKEGLDFGILRLGNLDKIHPDVQEFTLAKRKQAVTVEQLEKQLMSPPVVATTCLSVDHALFNRRKFDYCIVDEASQITLPTCLGPIRFADRFVLVGDHFQLPPLVRSVQARQGGLDVSLFRRLSNSHPAAVVELAHQYRMNEEIMMLSNRLIYGERLRCGSESVRTRKLTIPRWDAVKGLCQRAGCLKAGQQQKQEQLPDGHGKCWLRELLDEKCKAVFVDTDGIPGYESRAGDLIQNEIEAELVKQVTETLILGGVSPDQVGIITLYRQQVKLISHLLGGRKDVEILTADRSQGRDKDVVMFSMVRSNDEGRTGDLVKDWRRMNVSFTRARSKLIIFGSRQTLQATPLLKEFFELMDEKGWVLSMPDGAHNLHASVLRDDAPVVNHAESEPTVIDMDIDGKRITDDEQKVTPSKRSGPAEKENLEGEGGVEESTKDKVGRPVKKMRKSLGVDSGIVKGKPLLLDLINEGL
ncbi:DNA replication ATP-dependent helicase/nuclease DNA2 [Leucoagaricus sp. SymC.cos]|nr:DNA replication ATP-dependent helicase/nuclease DNA2 [Leucoagaricus sp. SymC.cos]